MFDITVPLREGMLQYPEDPLYRREWWYAIERGNDCNVSNVHLSVHTGTHMDAPYHFLQDAQTLDQLPPERFVGDCRLAHIAGRPVIDEADLRPLAPRRGERLLLKTDNADGMRSDVYNPRYVALTPRAARYLAACGVQAVGIDYLSIEPYGQDGEVHRILLGAGIVVYEGYDASAVPAGDYELLALPMLIEKSDGAPCRMLLREHSSCAMREKKG